MVHLGYLTILSVAGHDWQNMDQLNNRNLKLIIAIIAASIVS
jgi:hypothetical protein